MWIYLSFWIFLLCFPCLITSLCTEITFWVKVLTFLSAPLVISLKVCFVTHLNHSIDSFFISVWKLLQRVMGLKSMLVASLFGIQFVRILLKLIRFLQIYLLINVFVLFLDHLVFVSCEIHWRKSFCFVFHLLEVGMNKCCSFPFNPEMRKLDSR